MSEYVFLALICISLFLFWRTQRGQLVTAEQLACTRSLKKRMNRDWEALFGSWSQPPSQTEIEKCENAVRAIRRAINASANLATRNIEVFPHGSYRNRTNVRADSDVDICVCCRESTFYDLTNGLRLEDVGLDAPATYTYGEFKNDLQAALVAYFGAGSVLRGNKAFDVHENTYRVSADAIACFEYQRYDSPTTLLTGIAFLPDIGDRVVNWPQQNYENGVAKNDRTGRDFKALVRILKELKGEMASAGYESARLVPSYLIECLLWNVPDEGFEHATRAADLRYALAHLFNETLSEASCNEWGEINELKYLFRGNQQWTVQSVHRFTEDAWNFIGF